MSTNLTARGAPLALAMLLLSACGTQSESAPSGSPVNSSFTTSPTATPTPSGQPATVTGRVTVGAAPCGILGAAGSIWVSLYGEGKLLELDPATLAVRRTVPVGTSPCGLAYGAGSIWVENYGSNDVTRVDTVTGAVVATIDVGSSPYDVAVVGDSAWVTDYASQSISRISLSTNQRTVIEVDANPVGIVGAGGKVWAGLLDGTALALDPVSGAVVSRVDIGEEAIWTAASGDELWIGDRAGKAVVHVNARTGTIVGRVPVAAIPLDGDVLDGVAWIPDKLGRLHGFDAVTGEPIGLLDSAATEPFVIAGFEGMLWVADYRGTDVVRIRPPAR